MQVRYKIPAVSLALIAVLFGFERFSKKLIEQPFRTFTPEYFKTVSGSQNAVNALYSGMRWIYDPEGAVAVSQAGTDEFTTADQTRTGAAGDLLTICNYTLDPANGAILTPWNRSFNNINLANAVVGFATEVSIDNGTRNILIAEARFLRGLYYLGLVTQFGAVPLDLGTGELQFNQNPFQGFNRLPTDQLLVNNYQAMIDDFTFATQNLPERRPANAFKLSKAVAYSMLSRTYMYRAYSTAEQATDYASAYTAAMEIINYQAKYGVGLLPDYADVHREGNDYNQEILYSVKRIPGDINSNESLSGAIGGGKGVDAANDFNPD